MNSPAESATHSIVPFDKTACLEAYRNRYHKIKAEVGYDEWEAIWKKAAEWGAAAALDRAPPRETDSEGSETDATPAGKVRHTLHLPLDLHPATQDLVRNFAEALGEKLYGAQVKYGWTDGWRTANVLELQAELMNHVAKGDPRDVAAFCAFLWSTNSPTTTVGYINEAAYARVMNESRDLRRAVQMACDARDGHMQRATELQRTIDTQHQALAQQDALEAVMVERATAGLIERHKADHQHWRADIERLTDQLEAARCQSVQAAITVLQAAMAHTNASLTIDQQAHAEVVYGSGLDSLRVPPNELAEVIESLECLAAHAEAPF